MAKKLFVIYKLASVHFHIFQVDKQNNRYLLHRHIRQLHYSTQNEVFFYVAQKLSDIKYFQSWQAVKIRKEHLNLEMCNC